MSHILDALNKSEQDRARKTPNLKSVHVHPTATTGSRIKPLLVVTLLVSGLLATGYILLIRPPSTTSLVVEPVVGLDDPVISSENSSQSRIADTPAIQTIKPRAITNESNRVISDSMIAGDFKANDPETTKSTRRELPVLIDDLPLSLRNDLPELTFSTHIYATEQDWRKVGINGLSRSEGETISADLSLVEITERGVILDFRGHLIEMSVIDEWAEQ